MQPTDRELYSIKTAGPVSQRVLRVVCFIETMKNGFLIVTIELK